MKIKRRLYYLFAGIFFVVMAGTMGYYILSSGKQKLIDCLYMTVISLTGVGYGEVIEVSGNPSAQIFTMVLITFGMGIILYGLGTITAFIIEGDLTGILREKKMQQKISKLKNHYIVCGGGQTGRSLVSELLDNNEQVVLIEPDKKKLALFESLENMLYIHGDATEDKNLLTAGIDRANGIIIGLPSDKDNLYITMTARMLNKKIRIISRIIDPKIESKLKKAGADGVVSPDHIGALRMASKMIRPTAVDFLDKMLRSKKGILRIHEISITDKSHMIGCKISESGLESKFGLLILGSMSDNEEIKFNPPPSLILEKGMTLIVMGEVKNISNAVNVFSMYR